MAPLEARLPGSIEDQRLQFPEIADLDAVVPSQSVFAWAVVTPGGEQTPNPEFLSQD